ncbi:MAG: RICIN domain-containing protein [Ferruginibacter sp.]
MKNNSFIFSALVCFIFLQSCHKDSNPVTVSKSIATLEKTSGLKLNSVGDYGTYKFISSDAGLSAQIASFSLENGGTGNLAAYTGAGHQKWRITNVGNGNYTIMNMGSGKLAQSYNYNGVMLPVQNSADHADDQLWIISSVGGNGYKVISKSSGLAVTANGSNYIQLQPYIGKASQIWGYNLLSPDSYRDDAVVGFFHRRLKTQGSIAFDQGNSIPLSDGRVLWITQDAFDGIRVLPDGNLMCGFFQYHNSILIQPATKSWNPDSTGNMTIANSTANQPRQICNTQPGTDWSWPGMGFQQANTVFMVCGEGKGLGATNTSIYELTVNSPGNDQWAVKRTLPAGIAGQTEVGYGLGFSKPGDGYIYTLGSKGVSFNASNIYAARAAESDPRTWYFWNGTAWTTTRTTNSASVVATGQQNLAMCYVRGKYVLMQMDLGFFCDPSSHNIYLSTSNSITGPFTKPVKVFTIEDRYRGHLNRYYTPACHPEFDNGKNELLLTYSVNFAACSTGNDCANNELESKNYQVKGVRVPYSVIGL